MKTIQVKCPECGLNQSYKPYKDVGERRSQMRKKCNRCGKTFKVSKQKLEKFQEDSNNEIPRGFVKYNKNGYEKVEVDEDDDN